MKLIKVRFVRDAIYRVRGYSHPDNPVFKTGETHEFRDDIAMRWLKRGAAVLEKEAKAKPEAQDGNELPAGSGDAAPKADGDDGGDKPQSDKRQQRKGVARDN